MMHVKFMVLPLLMNISGPPIIVVMGSEIILFLLEVNNLNDILTKLVTIEFFGNCVESIFGTAIRNFILRILLLILSQDEHHFRL